MIACCLWGVGLSIGSLQVTARPLGSGAGGDAVVEAASQVERSVDSCATEVRRGARLSMEQAFHDFGDVPRKGGNLVHDFPFVNNGNVPLVVTRVVTSCSCIKASFPRRPVAPGAKEYIRITYEPLKSEPGTFHKVIQIFSNAEGGLQVITVQGCSVEE